MAEQHPVVGLVFASAYACDRINLAKDFLERVRHLADVLGTTRVNEGRLCLPREWAAAGQLWTMPVELPTFSALIHTELDEVAKWLRAATDALNTVSSKVNWNHVEDEPDGHDEAEEAAE